MKNKKTKLTLLQKAGLICCGVIFALLVLEAGLRLAGGVMFLLDNFRNNPHTAKGFERKDTFTVLCLGPCYTTGVGVIPEESYPSRLEDILASHYPDRHFLVINRGVRGKNLSFFVNRLESLIRKYHPDLIVLNVNSRITIDDENLLESISDSFNFTQRLKIKTGVFVRSLKVYKIFSLFFGPAQVWIPGPDEKSFQTYSQMNKNSLSGIEIQRLQKAVEVDPDNPMVWFESSRSYAWLGLYEIAAQQMEKAIALNPQDGRFYIELFWDYCFLGEYKLALLAQKKVFEVDPNFGDQLKREIDHILEQVKLYPWDYRLYDALGHKYALFMDYGNAIIFTKKALSLCPDIRLDYARLNYYLAAQQILKNKPYKKGMFNVTPVVPDGVAWCFVKELDDLLSPQKVRLNSVGLDGPRIFEKLLQFDLEKAKKITRKYRIKILLENSASSMEQQDIIKNICSLLQVPLADIYAAFKDVPSPWLLFKTNLPYQFNARGYDFIAEQVFKALQANNLING
jgi:hypothetical protein